MSGCIERPSQCAAPRSRQKTISESQTLNLHIHNSVSNETISQPRGEPFEMNKMKSLKAGLLTGIFLLAAAATPQLYAGDHDGDDHHGVRHVLLISIDGMHALDFANCSKGI